MTSKYRCETCNTIPCPYHEFLREKYKKDLHTISDALTERQEVICVVGCASHSGCVEDFVSLAGKMEEVSRKDEREKVLKEAINAIEERINGIFDAYRDEKNEKLTELPFASANGMGECIIILKKLRMNDQCNIDSRKGVTKGSKETKEGGMDNDKSISV